MDQFDFKPGTLVHVRGRDWVVQPSPNKDLLLLKPLDGSEADTTGIYLPLAYEADRVESTHFKEPSINDIGSFSSARILFNAARFSVRNVSGPFRSMGRLSFRPRAYQMVPLIMALRQEHPVRLLIADDVGVGKTIEALLVLKEFLERKEISRFAVIALPHLCGQWQMELKDKFSIDAEIIRSNTQSRLDRQIPDDTGVFQYYPYQVISIDFIKSETRWREFVQNCPEMVIVDEAHTCSVHSRADKNQQQRHRLIKELSKNKDRSLILLTATPHSGKGEQFNSLLGLLEPGFIDLDVPNASQEQRRQLARYYVQRRRKDVEKWSHYQTPFPERDSGEYLYELSPEYADFYFKVRRFALGLTPGTGKEPHARRVRYWAALALLRGVMSSPAAGINMLKNRLGKNRERLQPDYNNHVPLNPLLDEDFAARDFAPTSVFQQVDWTENENAQLNKMARILEELRNLKMDKKAAQALKVIRSWLVEGDGFNPIIFCRYIATANYLGQVLKEAFEKEDGEVNVQTVTSEDPDEVRRTRIDDMVGSERKVLVATDCLSEGINLQDQFTAVLHYDLPWNPNRLEQREGRIDRYGQPAKKVKAYLLYSKENPMDKIVFKVLLEKIRQIRKATGISIPFPEDSQSFLDAVLQEVITTDEAVMGGKQRRFAFDDFQPDQEVLEVTKEIDVAAAREKVSHSIFAQNAIKPGDIEKDLLQSDKCVGTPEDVEAFVKEALKDIIGVQVTPDKIAYGYSLFTANLPPELKVFFPDKLTIKISFQSPTPEGYTYLGRNHGFVEQLCQTILGRALGETTDGEPKRAAVLRCKQVKIKTTILLLRARNVIKEHISGRELVTEEMLAWGYRGTAEDRDIMTSEEVENLMKNVTAGTSLEKFGAANFLDAELQDIKEIRDTLDNVARNRSQLLVDAHERFRSVIQGNRYKIVEPVLPMDFMGIYILLPEDGIETGK